MSGPILEIGKSIPRVDARTKVTGKEEYAADYRSPGMLWAGVKRAGIPHGRIRGIHDEEALKIPGVLAVLTHRDVKGTNRQGVIRKDQPVLADDKVRHAGDPVALVVAEDKAILSRAMERITLELEPLEAVFDPEEALRDGAPLIHERHPGGNLLLEGSIEKGLGAAAFDECDLVVELRFETPRQEHAYLETEAGWALCGEDGTLEITASTQTPFRDRAEVAEALGLDPENIRILAPYCGGAFGGKDGITVQSLLGLAALHVPGKPVKMWWSREESFLASVKRHPARLFYRLGVRKDGAFHALEATANFDTGPYDHLGGVVMALGLEHAGGPYRIPNASLKARVAYTNNPIGGAFRGFGVPQVNAAMEQVVDMAAERLGISPLEIRLRNAVRRGDRNPVGVSLTGSTGILECLESLKDHPLWRDRQAWKGAAGPFKSRGVGMASVMHGMGYGPVVPDTGNAKIELTGDGMFRVFCGVVDMGQGNVTTYLQIAGQILGQDLMHMEAVLPDTSRTLPSGSSSASRTTYTFGNAIIGAAEILKGRLLDRAADLLMAPGREDMALVPGAIRHLPTGRDLPLRDLARRLAETERMATCRFRAPVARENLPVHPDVRLHGFPHLLFSYAAHLACVEVDRLTGEIQVWRYVAVTECGRILNPQLFEQQIQGGIAQSLGYALMEQFTASKGRIETPDLSTYIIPTALDVPDMDSRPVELHEPSGPFGLKGAGEVATDGPLPAVANALADACGIRPGAAPFTPERVLTAIRDKGDEADGTPCPVPNIG
ncbi:MAG: xanthine dehydrogenase family protein molybdopterin-binding subunit [Deltaproteobacteria bacterium]|nr:xanthine dehydrogenase family protein molybdopterin-binding subunit [Deltaproteobacteria bacterium]